MSTAWKDSNRAEFEAWALSDPYAKILAFHLFGNGIIEAPSRTYLHIDTEISYRAWQASTVCGATTQLPDDGKDTMVPDGSWLWCKLMDWCQTQGVSPAIHNSLFKIVEEAHVLNRKHKEQSVSLVRTTIEAACTSILETNHTDPQKIIEELRDINPHPIIDWVRNNG